MASVISIADLGPALPDAAFGNMLTLANRPFGRVDRFQINMGPNGAPKLAQKAAWHVSGIRIDPSAPGGSDAIRKAFGTSPQIRLILSPVTDADKPEPTVHDFALHLIYSYIGGFAEPTKAICRRRPKPDREKFKQIVEDLAQLKKDLADGKIGATAIKTDGLPLGIHPALADDKTKAGTRDRIKSFLEKHLPQGSLVAMAVMGLNGGNPEPWIFLSMAFDPDKKAFVPVPSPGVLQPLEALKPGGDPSKLRFAQALSFVTPSGVLPEPANNNMNPATCESVTVPKGNSQGV